MPEEITPNQISDDSESLVASFNQSTSGICVRERLRDHIRFWREIGGSNFVLRVLESVTSFLLFIVFHVVVSLICPAHFLSLLSLLVL